MTMTSLKPIAAALLSTLAVSPVFAQAAISEPGAFSFYHPDRDVLNAGAPVWGGRAVSAPDAAGQAYAATESSAVVHHARRHRSGYTGH